MFKFYYFSMFAVSCFTHLVTGRHSLSVQFTKSLGQIYTNY